MNGFPIRKNAEPPKGMVYNYPIQPGTRRGRISSRPRRRQPSPCTIAMQMHDRGAVTGMLARFKQGGTIPSVLAWAHDEPEGFVR